MSKTASPTWTLLPWKASKARRGRAWSAAVAHNDRGPAKASARPDRESIYVLCPCVSEARER